jgi:hypothetical protein
MTNAKIHIIIINKIEYLCLQIGLVETIYIRLSDRNEINVWLKVIYLFVFFC